MLKEDVACLRVYKRLSLGLNICIATEDKEGGNTYEICKNQLYQVPNIALQSKKENTKALKIKP